MAEGRKTRRNLAVLGSGVGAAGLLGLFGGGGDTADPGNGAGERALERLDAIYSGEVSPQEVLDQIPGFQARQQAISRGVQASASARGTLRSGGALRSLAREQGAFASEAFQGYLQNLGRFGTQMREMELSQQMLEEQRARQRQTGFGQLLGAGAGFLASGGNPAGAAAGSQIGGNLANLFG